MDEFEKKNAVAEDKAIREKKQMEGRAARKSSPNEDEDEEEKDKKKKTAVKVTKTDK